jgi:NADH:ubiquinone reductase (H+-translocating)
MPDRPKVLVVGGGFGGIRAALDLAKQRNLSVMLLSDKPYFEYQPALYRVATAMAPLGAVVSLSEIFKGKSVEVIEDRVVEVSPERKTVTESSGKSYQYDFLVLALGSEVNYHGLSVLKSLTFCLKTVRDALRLYEHLNELFSSMEKATDEQKVEAGHVVVVGAGATGAEVAGGLTADLRRLAKEHNLDASYVTVDLIDSGSRPVEELPEEISSKVQARLRDLGVNIFLHREIVEEQIQEIYLKDMHLKTKTVVWAAGVTPNKLYSKIEGLSFDKKGRVVLDEFLRVKGHKNIFTVGDGASDPNSGTAQAAIHQGRYVAGAIGREVSGRKLQPYESKKSSVAVPVGTGWASVLIGNVKVNGRIGWWLRRLGDLRFYLSILPPLKALRLFFGRDGLNNIDALTSYIEKSN